MKEFFKKSWIRLTICLIFGLLIVIINNLIRKNWNSLDNYCDGFFIGGFSIICIGCLSVLNYFGAFDVFQYTFRRKPKNSPSESLYDFSNRKKETRHSGTKHFIPYFIIGSFYLIISLVLFFI